jgi:hypothetical protein
MSFMNSHRFLILGLLALANGLSGETGWAATSEDQTLNNGEDFTKPINRFDMRFQFETLPDATESGRLFDDRHTETMTLRSDLVFFRKPDQLALRFDLPMEWSNKPTSQNPNGRTRYGLGDLLAQALYVHTFDDRWAGAVGLQMLLPTATGQAFGNGKWQLAPSIGARAELPELSKGSYVGLAVREFVSVAGSATRSNINYLSFEPAINIALPDQWFLNSNPKLRYNLETEKWFIPLDLMVGKKFGARWVASIEYQYGLVKDDPKYNQWVEGRIGYFF